VYGPYVFASEIEGELEYALPDVRVITATRTPCLICGHPTGDCPGESVQPRHILGDEMFQVKKSEEPEILVLEDLYDTVQITPRTTTRVLVARAGSYISQAKAVEFGLIPS
jgi:hypothetical protein